MRDRYKDIYEHVPAPDKRVAYREGFYAPAQRDRYFERLCARCAQTPSSPEIQRLREQKERLNVALGMATKETQRRTLLAQNERNTR